MIGLHTVTMVDWCDSFGAFLAQPMFTINMSFDRLLHKPTTMVAMCMKGTAR